MVPLIRYLWLRCGILGAVAAASGEELAFVKSRLGQALMDCGALRRERDESCRLYARAREDLLASQSVVQSSLPEIRELVGRGSST